MSIISFSVAIFLPLIAQAQCLKHELRFEKLSDGVSFAKSELLPNWERAHIPPLSDYETYSAEKKKQIDTDPLFLLKRQREFFKWDQEVYERMTRVIEGKLGTVERAGCLEKTLMDAQLKSFGDETEFLAYVLKKGIKSQVLVMSWGREHVNPSKIFNETIEQLIHQGWSPEINLHNHPLFMSYFPEDVAGTIIPSYPDFALYQKLKKSWGLKSAWVTNAFSTGRFNSKEFNP